MRKEVVICYFIQKVYPSLNPESCIIVNTFNGTSTSTLLNISPFKTILICVAGQDSYYAHTGHFGLFRNNLFCFPELGLKRHPISLVSIAIIHSHCLIQREIAFILT